MIIFPMNPMNMNYRFMDNWYRRDGTPYPQTREGVVELNTDQQNPEVRVVKQEHLPNGYWISTVWLGYNHRWDEGPPIIFETMVTSPSGDWEDYQERYATENDAIVGHLAAVDLYANKDKP